MYPLLPLKFTLKEYDKSTELEKEMKNNKKDQYL